MKKVVEYIGRLVPPPDTGATDAHLLGRFVTARDEAAFAAILRRHGPMVLGVCRRMLANDADAEDAFQAAFFVLARRAASVVKRESLAAWLFGVAYRTALEARTARCRRRARETPMPELPHPQIDAGEVQDWRPLLDEELGRLPEKYRATVVLADLEGRTRKEVARMLGVPEGTVSSRLAAARRLLAGRLARHGLPLPVGAVSIALSQSAASACVPSPLLVSTVRVAASVAAGSATGGAIPVKVAAMGEGVMKAMVVIRLRQGLVLLLTIGLLFVAGVTTYHSFAAARTADKTEAEEKAEAKEKVGEVRRFEGHDDWVYTVAVSPDGRRALSGSASEEDKDGVVRLWDLDTGKDVRRLEGHTSGVMAVAFSRDGKRGVSASDDQTVRLWDLDTGKELKRFEGHTDQVWAVAFSPDGKRLASGGRDKSIRLWDVTTGKELKSFEGHAEGVRTLAFSPDGKRLLSGGFDGVVRLWDVEGGNEVRTFEGHTDAVQCVAFSRDGRRALSCGLDKTIRLWNVEGGNKHCVFTGHSDVVTSVAFSPDGKRLLSGSWDQTVRLWDVESGEVLHSFSEHDGKVQSVAFMPDGHRALSGSRDKTLRLWRLPK